MDTTAGVLASDATEEVVIDGALTDADCKLFTFILYVGIFGPMLLFGLVGNTVSFVVLQWEKQNKVATFLLQVMAVIDNLFLLFTGTSQIFAAVTLFTNTNHPAAPFMMILVWPFVHITQMAAVWITVLIALNRYIAICRPFQAPNWCSMSRARLQLIVMSVVIVLYNIPRFFEFEIRYVVVNPETNSTELQGHQSNMSLNSVYIILYQNILYCLFVFLGPLLILIVFNFSLCRELWRARQRLISRNLPVSGEEEEQNLTLVMIVIILIFLVCQTPAFLNQLFPLILGEDAYMCGKAYYYYYHISNLFVSANSSLNFVVYCVFRKQFRARLWAFCGCKGSQSMHLDSSCSGYTHATYAANGKSGAAHL